MADLSHPPVEFPHPLPKEMPKQMDFKEYIQKTSRTDSSTHHDEAIQTSLLGIAEKAGSVLSEAKKCLRGTTTAEGLRDRIGEELGDLLWYIAQLSRHMDLDVDQILQDNLYRTQELWNSTMPSVPNYDDNSPPHQKFPRRFRVRFDEKPGCKYPIVQMSFLDDLSDLTCDPLDDNSEEDDGYRYHDIFHLTHATILGWSPVLRTLLKRKRKHDPNVDRIQDGARAKAIEEGVVAFIFNYLRQRDFSLKGFDWNLFRYIKSTVRFLEVATQPLVAWRSAYSQAVPIFQELHKVGGGVVECDLDDRKLTSRGNVVA